MRVGINAALLGERHSGVASYVAGLVGCLADLGHDVVVYTSSLSIRDDTRVQVRVQVKKSSGLLTFEKGLLASALRFLWNQIIFPLRMMRDRVDVAFVQNTDAMFLPPVPQILVIHDTIPLLYPQETPRLYKYYKYLLPRIIRNSSAVATVSDASRSDLVRYYGVAPDRIRVTYQGASDAFANLANDKKPHGLDCQRFFLFVGTFAPRKNLATVVEALAKAPLVIKESLVVVAYPDKWMLSEIERIAGLGLSDRVVIVKNLQPSELGYLYRHATALFLLSEYEGFGLPALEAMIAGTPAVVSDTAALAEVVDDAAIKIRAHDTDAAAEVMCRLSLDQRFRQEWQRKGLERARMFTWQRTGEQLGKLLQDFS